MTVIKLQFVIKIFVLSIFEWPLKKGFTVYSNYSNCTKLQEDQKVVDHSPDIQEAILGPQDAWCSRISSTNKNCGRKHFQILLLLKGTIP